MWVEEKEMLAYPSAWTLEVLAKAVVSWKQSDTYAEILTLICAANVVWEVWRKKTQLFENSFWLKMTNNEVMVAQKYVVVKFAL